MSDKFDEPAFPFVIDGHAEPGLTKREYFAAAAIGQVSHVTPALAAEFSVQYADALIAELAKLKLEDKPTDIAPTPITLDLSSYQRLERTNGWQQQSAFYGGFPVYSDAKGTPFYYNDRQQPTPALKDGGLTWEPVNTPNPTNSGSGGTAENLP